MSDPYSQARSIPTGRADMAVDAGLRRFMLGVFNKMALGLAVSAGLAYLAATVEPLARFFFTPPMIWVVMFGPLALIVISMFAMRNPSPAGANLLYWAIVGLIGIGLGATLMIYANRPGGVMDIAKAFLITSATFGGLSLWGYTTKRDLTGWGTFLIMGIWGLVLASLVNFGVAAFTGAPIANFSFIISIVGVLLFAGLTAWETQQLKFMYYEIGGDERALAVTTTMGALNLYIAFVNMFRFILSLISSRE